MAATRRITTTLIWAGLLLNAGCRVVVPSVRTSSPPCLTCQHQEAPCVETVKKEGFAGPAPASTFPARVPATSRFHPVPTRPVFEPPRLTPVAGHVDNLWNLVPTPAAEPELLQTPHGTAPQLQPPPAPADKNEALPAPPPARDDMPGRQPDKPETPGPDAPTANVRTTRGASSPVAPAQLRLLDGGSIP